VNWRWIRSCFSSTSRPQASIRKRGAGFARLIETLRQELQLTVVMVTHDVDTLIVLADRVAVLADQRLVTIGPLSEVAQFPHPFVDSFFLRHRIGWASTARTTIDAHGRQADRQREPRREVGIARVFDEALKEARGMESRSNAIAAGLFVLALSVGLVLTVALG